MSSCGELQLSCLSLQACAVRAQHVHNACNSTLGMLLSCPTPCLQASTMWHWIAAQVLFVASTLTPAAAPSKSSTCSWSTAHAPVLLRATRTQTVATAAPRAAAAAAVAVATARGSASQVTALHEGHFGAAYEGRACRAGPCCSQRAACCGPQRLQPARWLQSAGSSGMHRGVSVQRMTPCIIHGRPSNRQLLA